MASLNLTPELEATLQNFIRSGRYANKSEVIRAGLRCLEEKELLNQALNLFREKLSAPVAAKSTKARR